MELQSVFYLIGIIFMGWIIILSLIMLAVLLAIKAKINHLQSKIDSKVHKAKNVAHAFTTGINTLRNFVRS